MTAERSRTLCGTCRIQKNGQTMKKNLSIATALFCLIFPFLGRIALAATCAEDPWRCRDEVARIEQAFRIGMAAASSPDDEMQCLRLRNAGLAFLVERDYEAALSLLAARSDLLQALQDDQARWQEEVDATESRTRRGLEVVAEMHVARLEVFGLLTGEAEARNAFPSIPRI